MALIETGWRGVACDGQRCAARTSIRQDSAPPWPKCQHLAHVEEASSRPKWIDGSLQCSFCGKAKNQVDKLIAGPDVYICNECIGLCNEIIEEEQTPAR